MSLSNGGAHILARIKSNEKKGVVQSINPETRIVNVSFNLEAPEPYSLYEVELFVEEEEDIPTPSSDIEPQPQGASSYVNKSV